MVNLGRGSRITVGPGAPGPAGAPGGSDAAMAAWVADTASQTRAALSATYATPTTVDARTFLGSNFAFFGDSITNYGEGYPYYAQVLSGGKFRAAHIKANSGQTSTAILPLLATQVVQADPKPTACLVLCGANDAIVSTPLSTYRANVESMVSQLRAAGIAPVLATIPPNNTDATDTFVRTYNAWLMRYAEVNRIPLVDFYTLLIDQATGNWQTAYDGGDGLHPSAAANKVMGQAVVDTLAPLLTPHPYSVQPFAGDPNHQLNSNFLVDTNSDGLADSLSTTPVAGLAYARIADPAGFRWQRLTLSGGGTLTRSVGGRTMDVTTHFAVGDRIRFATRVRSGQSQAVASTPGAQVGVVLNMTCYTAAEAVILNVPLTSFGLSRQVEGITSTEFMVPANTAKIRWSFAFGPADGTYDIAQPTIYNLTRNGLI